VLPGSKSLTVPTVAATRPEIWTVRNGRVVRVLPGAQPQEVTASAAARLGTIEVLQLSPDGVRAALVIDGGAGPVLYLGTVVRSEGGDVALGDLREVNQAIEDAVDVTWRAGDTLMLLADNPAGDAVVPYEVGVDGWGLTEVPTSGLPADATAIAAAPNQEPLVSAGDPGGEPAPTIWRLTGVRWETLVLGAPPQPGTEPFYPL
jgi:hypothetical protein